MAEVKRLVEDRYGSRRGIRFGDEPALDVAAALAGRRVRGDESLAMRAPAGNRAFAMLFREFFSQLFITESSVSDHQLRQAMIGVLAFVITPGFFLPLQLGGPFEAAVLVHPSAALSLPLLAAFWVAGLRASFFVPSELTAAWTFSMNAVAIKLLTMRF
jgi:hypothetical protein